MLDARSNTVCVLSHANVALFHAYFICTAAAPPPAFLQFKCTHTRAHTRDYATIMKTGRTRLRAIFAQGAFQASNLKGNLERPKSIETMIALPVEENASVMEAEAAAKQT